MRKAVSLGDERTASATRRLLSAAEELSPGLRHPDERARFEQFKLLYRDWVMFHRGAPGQPADRHEKGSLLLHAMIGAATLGEALALLLRFNQLVWGQPSLTAMEARGDDVALVFERARRRGPQGQLTDMWELYFNLHRLEFLVGGALGGVRGQLCGPLCLPAGTAALLFDRPLAYDMAEMALIIPRRHLDRAVVAKGSQVTAFFHRDLTTALGSGEPIADMKALVAGLLRDDLLRNRSSAAHLGDVAARLGCSVATVRRRLAAEGTGFREISSEVHDELAKRWLGEQLLPIGEIAERLGYSDEFAFRRSFRAHNGTSPSAWRRRLASMAGGIGH
jgi:AraC-like DNA-binding protein